MKQASAHMLLRAARPEDAADIVRIYNWYVDNTVITFDINPLTEEEMREKIVKISSHYPFFVLEANHRLVGYSYVNEFRTRYAYRFSLETSVYLDHEEIGKGYGTLLLKALIDASKQNGIHVLIASITLPNPESIGLHEKFGFTKAAHYHEVGWKFNRWLDVGFWEMLL